MKVRANASSLQRLVGQAWQYLGAWRKRGPMLIVLCRTTPDALGRHLTDALALMRQQGYAVVAVVAAA